jgi:hypothetical protein
MEIIEENNFLIEKSKKNNPLFFQNNLKNLIKYKNTLI